MSTSKGFDKILDKVLHRSEYSDRILGKPIVILPGLMNRIVEVTFCRTEKLLYKEIKDLFVGILNGMPGNPRFSFKSNSNTTYKAWLATRKSKAVPCYL
jgi:hypothetical protein